MDMEHIEYLGPFARALFQILTVTEFHRTDRLPCTFNYPGASPIGSFACSFLVFRAVSMTNERIDEWRKCIDLPCFRHLPNFITLHGNT